MEQAQALAVVRSLANGVDPETGEVFPAESAYQRPIVVRALYEAASALERQERFERRKAQLPAKTGEPWTEEEDRKLLAAFDAGRALQELAAAHERTMGAVRAPRRRGFFPHCSRMFRNEVKRDPLELPRVFPLEGPHHRAVELARAGERSDAAVRQLRHGA